MHITAARTPLEAAQKTALSLSRENMHADRIRQDVLLLSGRDDHFIPIRLHARQVEALVRARSVTDRVFTRDEHAQNHCQVGNIGLALDTILEWLDGVT